MQAFQSMHLWPWAWKDERVHLVRTQVTRVYVLFEKSLIWSWCIFRLIFVILEIKKWSVISLTRLRLDSFNTCKVFNLCWRMFYLQSPVWPPRHVYAGMCVHTRGSFKRWSFVCSHGKEWMKGGSAGYFGAGGDAKCKKAPLPWSM